MPKYSTGSGGGGGDGDSCELCGRSTESLRRANVAGAELLVCGECAPHDDARKGPSGSSRSDSRSDDGSGTSRQKRAAQQQAKVYDQTTTGDSTRWETEGTDYEKDRLPHLVSEYSDRVADARRDAGLTSEELAAELDVDESDLHAVEEGRATRAGVGGSVVRALEERFGIELVDE